MLELRANVALSRFLQDRGNPAEARQNLSESYSWFREGLDAPDLEEAKALFDSLG